MMVSDEEEEKADGDGVNWRRAEAGGRVLREGEREETCLPHVQLKRQ
jgi:hypothetical protein